MRDFINIILENEMPPDEPSEWQEAVEAADWKEAFFYAESPEEVARTLEAADARKVRFRFAPQMPPVYVFADYVVEWDEKSQYTNFETKENWIADVDPSDYFPNKEKKFNDGFWEQPYELYHATEEDHVADILKQGLQPRDETRGLSNRGVGPAVFTTSSYESALSGSYGNFVFKIDTEAMLRDRYCPFVSLEPPIVEAEGREAIAHTIGMEDYYDDTSSDMHPDTVIVYKMIPPKYLTLDKKVTPT